MLSYHLTTFKGLEFLVNLGEGKLCPHHLALSLQQDHGYPWVLSNRSCASRIYNFSNILLRQALPRSYAGIQEAEGGFW